MLSHREIMLSLARTIVDDSSVLNYCMSNFGRGLKVFLSAYADQVPGEEEAPFLWIYTDGESELISQDELFDIQLVVGVCPKTNNGEKRFLDTVSARSEDSNGLIVNGALEIVEDLRDIVLTVARNAYLGARVVEFTRTDNQLAHAPLEWAAAKISVKLDVNLESYL